jgi:uncharacterized cupin superfamily protein
MGIDLRHLASVVVFVAIAIAAMSAKHASATAKSTPGIINVNVGALSGAKLTTIEDIPFWKVVGKRGAGASNVTAFVSSDKKLDVGVSQYEQVTLELRNWPVDEFMYLIEGEVEITDASGRSHVYGPGDAFVMPKGFEGTWRQLSAIKKINVSYGSFE